DQRKTARDVCTVEQGDNLVCTGFKVVCDVNTIRDSYHTRDSKGSYSVRNSKSSRGSYPVRNSKSSKDSYPVRNSKSSKGSYPVRNYKSSKGSYPVRNSKSFYGQEESYEKDVQNFFQLGHRWLISPTDDNDLPQWSADDNGLP
ncbi:hypothetical protein Bpfe_000701, partial [Biomphalaria pfeifferi]